MFAGSVKVDRAEALERTAVRQGALAAHLPFGIGQPDSRSSCGEEHLLPPHSPLELPPSPGPGQSRTCWTQRQGVMASEVGSAGGVAL